MATKKKSKPKKSVIKPKAANKKPPKKPKPVGKSKEEKNSKTKGAVKSLKKNATLLKKRGAKLSQDVSRQKRKVTAKVKKLIQQAEHFAEEALSPLHEEDFTASEILKKVRSALTPTHLNLKNLSAAHKNHPESKKNGGGHYSLSVVSDLFSGLDLKSRQRWVMNLLSEQMGKAIHALQMELRSPEEVPLSNDSGIPMRRDLKVKAARPPKMESKKAPSDQTETDDSTDTKSDDF
jgi:BolA protein